MFEGRASAQGPRQQTPYENLQQQMPCPAPGIGGPLRTAEAGDKQMGISSVEEALGGSGIQ